MKPSALQDQTYAFAIRRVRMYQYLSGEKKEFILSKQVMRSCTSIGAQVAEAGFAQSKNDFIAKLSIAAKEAHETHYWLRLLKDTDHITPEIFKSLIQDLEAIERLLTASLKTAKKNNE